MAWKLLRKRWILRAQRRRLPRALVRRYGRREAYEPEQVRGMLRELDLSSAYDCYAIAVFCGRDAFDAHHAALGESCNWESMRAELGLDAHATALDAPSFGVAHVTAHDGCGHDGTAHHDGGHPGSLDHGYDYHSVDHGSGDFGGGDVGGHGGHD